MTDTAFPAGDAPRPPVPSGADLPDNLPPVQPPSAGFIFQLFIVPALIVLALVGVWGLFLQLASGEQDWQALVTQLESTNPHLNEHAMFSLAQLLDVDRRKGDRGQHLSQQPKIAQALADKLQACLRDKKPTAIEQAVYCSRALGKMEVPEIVWPALTSALGSDIEVEIRKGALIAFIERLAAESTAGAVVDERVAQAMIEVSQDPDEGIRRAGCFGLGCLSDADSAQRLAVLLDDSDWLTAVNAAVALARRGSTVGYPVLAKVVAGEYRSSKIINRPGSDEVDGSLVPPGVSPNFDEKQREERRKVQEKYTEPFERAMILKNALKAIADVGGQFTPEQQAELRNSLNKLIETQADRRTRVDAEAALSALNSPRKP